MRLLFVAPDMRTGGAERHWATLIGALAERGFEVKLLTLAARGPFFEELVERGVAAQCLDLRRRTDPRGLRRALSVAASFGPEAVVSRGVSGQLIGEAIARRSRAVHVYNEHTPLTPTGRLLPPRPHQRALTRLVARAIDEVVAVTQRQVPPLEALGYPQGRIAVVPNGVFARDVEGVVPSEELDGDGSGGAFKGGSGAREGGGSAERAFTVVCVSGLRPEKRVDLFVESVGAARRENAAIRGFVAGEGPERQRLEGMAAAAGVKLLGARRDVLALVAAAGAVCLPSEAEALPMSILEAMALARPVVATDVGGTRDQVLDGETGYLVPAGDAAAVTRALLRLAADPARAGAMGEAGRRRQREHFTGERMVDGYAHAFEEAIGRGQA
ncbi:MAG TPA: glycosyltransferase family 4 protein [Thermoleophilaceae bacterium]